MIDRKGGAGASAAEAVWDHVLAVREHLAAVVAADLSSLGDDDVDGVLVAVEEAARMLPPAQHAVAAEVTGRGLDEARGYTSPASYLRDVLRIPRAEASRRLRAIDRFQPRVQPTGQVLPPRYPTVAAALRAGEVSVDHARVIAASLGRLPAAVDAATCDAAEQRLVECARDWDPTAVHKCAVRLEAVLDPDGVLATERDHHRQREVSLSRDLHGMYRLHGRLDGQAANTLQLALDPLSRPDPPDGEDRDPRTVGQRRADALVQIASWSLDDDRMPTSGGSKPHVVVTTTLAELQAKAGTAWVNNGEPVSIPALLEQACAADVCLAVFGTTGELLHYGRTQRLASPALRRALIARDGGCAFDGCDAPPSHCDAHHLTPWSEGGHTGIDTMGLYCGRHHTLLHSGDWHAVMIHGVPHVIPPKWIDPDQKPRRNRQRHPP